MISARVAPSRPGNNLNRFAAAKSENPPTPEPRDYHQHGYQEKEAHQRVNLAGRLSEVQAPAVVGGADIPNYEVDDLERLPASRPGSDGKRQRRHKEAGTDHAYQPTPIKCHRRAKNE